MSGNGSMNLSGIEFSLEKFPPSENAQFLTCPVKEDPMRLVLVADIRDGNKEQLAPLESIPVEYNGVTQSLGELRIRQKYEGGQFKGNHYAITPDILSQLEQRGVVPGVAAEQKNVRAFSSKSKVHATITTLSRLEKEYGKTDDLPSVANGLSDKIKVMTLSFPPEKRAVVDHMEEYQRVVFNGKEKTIGGLRLNVPDVPNDAGISTRHYLVNVEMIKTFLANKLLTNKQEEKLTTALYSDMGRGIPVPDDNPYSGSNVWGKPKNGVKGI